MEAQHKSAQKTMGRNTFIIMTAPMARFLSGTEKFPGLYAYNRHETNHPSSVVRLAVFRDDIVKTQPQASIRLLRLLCVISE